MRSRQYATRRSIDMFAARPSAIELRVEGPELRARLGAERDHAVRGRGAVRTPVSRSASREAAAAADARRRSCATSQRSLCRERHRPDEPPRRVARDVGARRDAPASWSAARTACRRDDGPRRDRAAQLLGPEASSSEPRRARARPAPRDRDARPGPADLAATRRARLAALCAGSRQRGRALLREHAPHAVPRIALVVRVPVTRGTVRVGEAADRSGPACSSFARGRRGARAARARARASLYFDTAESYQARQLGGDDRARLARPPRRRAAREQAERRAHRRARRAARDARRAACAACAPTASTSTSTTR